MLAKATVALLLTTCLIADVTAFKKERLWLPKRFRYAMEKLEFTAHTAEQSERCTEVLSGKLDTQKSTETDFYFIVTCRDHKRRSYNLGYLYPRHAGEPTLINEQKLPDPDLIDEEEGISSDEAWPLCLQELKMASKNMMGLMIMEDNPVPGLADQQRYHFKVPVEAKDPRGNRLRYHGICEVSALGAVLNASLEVRRPDTSKQKKAETKPDSQPDPNTP